MDAKKIQAAKTVMDEIDRNVRLTESATGYSRIALIEGLKTECVLLVIRHFPVLYAALEAAQAEQAAQAAADAEVEA